MYLVTILLFTVIALSATFSIHAFAEKGDVGIISTKFGDIVISFRDDVAPKTVANFENLTKSGFYDGTIFHRITPGFIIQGGDPNTKNGSRNTWGKGTAGYTIPPEFSNLKHTKYMVSMAHPVTDINGASSQFFIVLGDAPWLDGKYTIFGQVTSGQDVIDKITSIKTDPKTNQPLDPNEARITKVVIISSQKTIQPSQSLPSQSLPSTTGNNNSSKVVSQEQNQQKIIDEKALQDMLLKFGPIVAGIIVVIIVIIISIKLKNRSKRNASRESFEKEMASNKIQKESAKRELDTIKKELGSTEMEVSKLKSVHQSMLTEIQSAKADLALIKSQYDQNKVELIKKQIESAKEDLDEIDAKKSRSISELENAQDKMESARKELNDIDSKINNAKSKLSSLQSQEEVKKKEIVLVKKELEFIEKELGMVGKEKDSNKIEGIEHDTSKIVEAASSVVASINAKYESAKKELEILRTECIRLKADYETVQTELQSLRSKNK
jgi:cyclophilin family peptidyl-prolyl cis-trans isomerase/predicted  nucleic acid-binding Zn-ribbon protein